MTALGLVMETMLRLLGPLFFPFFLLAWVIWNVSVAFLDIADEAHFYSYGFAFPVWNSIDASKAIIFATKNHLLQNFMVNFGWYVCVTTGDVAYQLSCRLCRVIGGSIALLLVVSVQRRNEELQNIRKRVETIEKENSARPDSHSSQVTAT